MIGNNREHYVKISDMALCGGKIIIVGMSHLIQKIMRRLRSVTKKQWRKICQDYQELRQTLLERYYHCSARVDYRTGCLRNKRDTPLILSLTTTPARMEKVYLCIESLLRQSCKPDHLLLWLPDTIKQDAIPVSLARLSARGLQIRFCKDIRSYTKIIHAVREYPDAIIVTADDDRLYPEDWLKQLFEAHRQDPEYILCHRAHSMTKDAAGNLDNYNNWNFLSPGQAGPSVLLFPTGTGGVLYPPASLHREVLNEKVFMNICPTADDVWLKAMSLLNGVSCKKVAPYFKDYYTIKGTQSERLWDLNKTANDPQIRAVFKRYALNELINRSHYYPAESGVDVIPIERFPAYVEAGVNCLT